MPDAAAGPPGARGAASTQLRRSVGTATATATSAGLAFAAVNYLAVVSLAAFAGGSSSWLAIAVAGLVVLLVAGIFSELNGLYPTAAGIRLWIGRAIGNRTGLVVTFTYMSTVVLVIAADAFLIGAAVQHAFGQPPALAYLWIVVLLALATAANLAGVKLAGWVQTVVTYTVLGSTVALSVVALTRPGAGLDKPFDLFGLGGFDGFQAIAFGLFMYAAFEWVTTTAEEARQPVVITRALFIAPLLIGTTAIAFSLALQHLVPVAESRGSAVPQLLLGAAALGTVGQLWMLAVTVLTAINTFNGGFLVASRFLYAAAREGSLPKAFARLNLRAVPWLSVVALAVVSGVLAALVFWTGQWLLLVAVGATLEAGVYAIASYCVLVLRRRETRERPFRLVAAAPLAGFGVVFFTVLALASGFADPRDPRGFSVAPIAVIVVLAGISTTYVLLVTPRLRAKAKAAAAARPATPRRRPQRPPAEPTESDVTRSTPHDPLA